MPMRCKNKAQWVGELNTHQPWFLARVKRTRMRNKMRRATKQAQRRK